MLKKILEKATHYFIVYIRARKRYGREGMHIFFYEKAYGKGRIIVSLEELKKQEEYILNDKLNEKEASEYRRKEVLAYCKEKMKSDRVKTNNQ